MFPRVEGADRRTQIVPSLIQNNISLLAYLQMNKHEFMARISEVLNLQAYSVFRRIRKIAKRYC